MLSCIVCSTYVIRSLSFKSPDKLLRGSNRNPSISRSNGCSILNSCAIPSDSRFTVAHFSLDTGYQHFKGGSGGENVNLIRMSWSVDCEVNSGDRYFFFFSWSVSKGAYGYKIFISQPAWKLKLPSHWLFRPLAMYYIQQCSSLVIKKHHYVKCMLYKIKTALVISRHSDHHHYW